MRFTCGNLTSDACFCLLSATCNLLVEEERETKKSIRGSWGRSRKILKEIKHTQPEGSVKVLLPFLKTVMYKQFFLCLYRREELGEHLNSRGVMLKRNTCPH